MRIVEISTKRNSEMQNQTFNSGMLESSQYPNKCGEKQGNLG
nr:MAG TPA: hypothetical protein [Caudoviricetes sp.]